MTILKKLLPIATVATLTASVTPLFTSCGIKTKGDFNREISQYTPTNLYKRETDKHEKVDTFTTHDAVNSMYFDVLKDNHQIIYDDLFEDLFGENPYPSTKSSQTYEFKGNLGLTLKDVQPSSTTTKVTPKTGDPYTIKEHLISFGLYADMSGYIEDSNPSKPTDKYRVDFRIKGQVELTNIPVVIDHVQYRFFPQKPYPYLWAIYIGDGFGSTENWSIAGKGKAEANMNGVEAGIDLDAVYTKDSDTKDFAFIWEVLFGTLARVSIRLPYLQDVEGPEHPAP